MKLVHVFDFDGVLFDHSRSWNFYPGISQLLRELSLKGPICLASKRAENTTYSEFIINALRGIGLLDCFTKICIYNRCKISHLKEILSHLNKDRKEGKEGKDGKEAEFKVILYDDDKLNITECSQGGYLTKFIDNKIGLRKEDILKDEDV